MEVGANDRVQGTTKKHCCDNLFSYFSDTHQSQWAVSAQYVKRFAETERPCTNEEVDRFEPIISLNRNGPHSRSHRPLQYREIEKQRIKFRAFGAVYPLASHNLTDHN